MWDTKIDKNYSAAFFFGHLASTSPDLLAKLRGDLEGNFEWLLLISANITYQVIQSDLFTP